MSQPAPQLPSLRPATPPVNPVVEEWLEKAVEDMETASRELAAIPKGNYDAVCFHSQQAVEKLMKGVLISKGITPPFTHDLATLEALITKSYPAWGWSSKELRLLTLGAVQYRYSGFAASRQDGMDAFDTACRMWPGLLALL